MIVQTRQILKELEGALSAISKEELRRAEHMIINARRVFCDGIGRSGLCCRAFAMRLMHLGMTSFFVGETITPAIEAGDLFLACSALGQSRALISRLQEAAAAGAEILAVTASPDSPLVELADMKLVVKANESDAEGSILPMGSVFEDAAGILFENMVVDLMKIKNETSDTMRARHANLE